MSMVKVKNIYHGMLSFPKLGISLDAGETVEVEESIADALALDRNIEIVGQSKKADRAREIPKEKEESPVFEEEVDKLLEDN